MAGSLRVPVARALSRQAAGTGGFRGTPAVGELLPVS